MGLVGSEGMSTYGMGCALSLISLIERIGRRPVGFRLYNQVEQWLVHLGKGGEYGQVRSRRHDP
jgi:hypothetical protein